MPAIDMAERASLSRSVLNALVTVDNRRTVLHTLYVSTETPDIFVTDGRSVIFPVINIIEKPRRN